MQRKRPPPAQRQIWTILLILALLVLFVLTVGASCTANPYLYGGPPGMAKTAGTAEIIACLSRFP